MILNWMPSQSDTVYLHTHTVLYNVLLGTIITTIRGFLYIMLDVCVTQTILKYKT